MNVVNVDIKLSSLCSNGIMLGIRGESNVTSVIFDITELINNYGEGNVQLLVKRSVDDEAYPVVISKDENIVVWIVSDVDTAYAGVGCCELWYYVDDAIAKTIVFNTYVSNDIGESSENPPDQYQGWVEEIVYAGAKVEEAVSHYPKIVDGYWYVWDVENEEWSNTGERATSDVSFQGSGIVINT